MAVGLLVHVIESLQSSKGTGSVKLISSGYM